MENRLSTFEKILSERTDKRIETEVMIPEYLPNITRIVKVSAVPFIRSRENSKDSISVEAETVFSVVYLSDFKDKLKCAVFPVEFSHSFPSRNIQEELADTGIVRWNIDITDEKAQMISPRKITVSCTAKTGADVIVPKSSEVFCSDDDEDIKKLKKSIPMLNIVPLPECEVRIDERITTDEGMPFIDEIVYSECNICTEELSPTVGSCTFSGTATVSCLYLSDDGDGAKYISFSKKLPFTASVSNDMITPESQILIHTGQASLSLDVTQDNYGESNGLEVCITFGISAELFFNSNALICMDAYSVKHDCSCEAKDIPYDVLCGKQSGCIKVSEKVRAPLGNITDIIFRSANASVLSTEQTENGLVANLRINLRLCGVNPQGIPESTGTSFNIKVPFGDRGDIPLDRCKFETRAEISELECRIENGEVCCDMEIVIDSLQYCRSTVRAVCAMDTDKSVEFTRNRTEYIISYPSADDSIWTVAKKYRVCPRHLCAANDISETDIACSVGKKTLVIPL